MRMEESAVTGLETQPAIAASVCAHCGRPVPPKTRGFSQVRGARIVRQFPLCDAHKFVAREPRLMLDAVRA